jgi:prolipoprotein diacylglyceryltransferase
MPLDHAQSAEPIRYPRYFRVCGYWVNSYKFFLCIGLYVAILVSAAAARRWEMSTLRVAGASLACAIAGMAGARVYFLVVSRCHDRRTVRWGNLWNSRDGGWSVFGALFGVIPMSLLMCSALSLPLAAYWDCLGPAILAGGPLVRLGCVFNGCCAGRETVSRWGLCLHDTSYRVGRRVPVQHLEIAWWLLGIAMYLSLWPGDFVAGSNVLAVLSWYGVGRFWLEPLRKSADLMFGGFRINQLVAALLAVASGAAFVLIN